MDLVQQSHDLFAQPQSSGVAGRRSAVRHTHGAEEHHEGPPEPHVGDERDRCRLQAERVGEEDCSSFKDGAVERWRRRRGGGDVEEREAGGKHLGGLL